MNTAQPRSSFTEAMLRFVEKLEEETTYCRHCGRALTDPQSIKRGIGPICLTKTAEGGEE